MTDNTMPTLRCPGHGDMVRLFGQAGGMFSVWLCESCGDLALHMEARGDIYWFKVAVIDRMGRRDLPRGMPHTASCGYCPAKFECSCTNPDGPHMCDRCDNAAEESKMPEGSTKRTDCNCFPDSGCEHQADAGERADEARQEAAYERQVEAYEASVDQMENDDEEDRVRQQEEAGDRQVAALEGDDLPW